ncbi:hypothetical protein RB5542 [Rhodopirellula baltica SH 1]|uniref:Uncharacterized protein n=1 Tax=Rhodopirellula baltica (strain DSM 10527 / NCIMB 13988 / SH1) TaxID=243090 RepID=Q7URP4_RHOBA|nr:hypothetical protein RB5542 [Rhodopirellula baltica SH 1]
MSVWGARASALPTTHFRDAGFTIRGRDCDKPPLNRTAPAAEVHVQRNPTTNSSPS